MKLIVATPMGARKRAIQKPDGPPPKSVAIAYAKNAPIIYRDPWATFGIRSTPRTRLRPEATMNRIVVRLRPTSICCNSADRVIFVANSIKRPWN
jgi:hypothetical protein